jgi:hypothetical protein
MNKKKGEEIFWRIPYFESFLYFRGELIKDADNSNFLEVRYKATNYQTGESFPQTTHVWVFHLVDKIPD